MWGAHNLITRPPGTKTPAAVPMPQQASTEGCIIKQSERKSRDSVSNDTLRHVDIQFQPQRDRWYMKCGRTAEVQRNKWALRQGGPLSLVNYGQRPARFSKARHAVVLDAAQHHFALPQG